LFVVVTISVVFFMAHTFKEFTSPYAWVFICSFIDHYCVVSTKERNNKLPFIIFLIFRNKSCFKTQYVLILSVHFINILSWRFWLESKDATERVFWRAITIVWRYWLNKFLLLLSWQFCTLLLNICICSIPMTSKFIAIIQKTFFVINIYALTT